MKLREYTEITPQVRQRVYERDSYEDAPCCIYCGRPYPEVHHFVERSRGGMGIEENLVCLCKQCHQRYHSTGDKKLVEFMRGYLMRKYPEWDERKLIKRKGDENEN